MIKFTYQIIIFHIITMSSLMAETTGNLLPQQFFNNNQEHNGWNCTDPSHNHGNSIVAAVHGDFIENTISLGDTLNQSQINGGWTSTLGADMWGWNQYDQEIRMTQTITGADGTVTTQIRDVEIPGCSGWNCGGYATYTDSYTQGINNQSNFTINARFDFSEASQSTSHRAIDLKNPTLVIEHSLLSQTQQTEISLINETVNDIVEQEIQTIEFAPIEEIEEFVIEIDDQQMFDLVMLDDMTYETDIIDDINTGVVEIFQEIMYDNTQEIEEVATEIEIEEVGFEAVERIEPSQTTEFVQEQFDTQDFGGEFETESFAEAGQTIYETTDFGGEVKPIPSTEESIGGQGEADIGEEINREGNGTPPTGNETTVVAESNREDETRVSENVTEESSIEVARETEPVNNDAQTEDATVDTETEVASEEVNETDRETETVESEQGDEGTEVASTGGQDTESSNAQVEESRDSESPGTVDTTISVENIERRVNQTIQRVDQRLIATSLIVAKAMSNDKILDTYNSVNQGIFQDQPVIDGGDYYETRNYIDARNIYAFNQDIYQDNVTKHHEEIEDAVEERIKAEEHLRRIRGY